MFTLTASLWRWWRRWRELHDVCVCPSVVPCNFAILAFNASIVHIIPPNGNCIHSLPPFGVCACVWVLVQRELPDHLLVFSLQNALGFATRSHHNESEMLILYGAVTAIFCNELMRTKLHWEGNCLETNQSFGHILKRDVKLIKKTKYRKLYAA